MSQSVATAFDFDPLPDGNVLIEFFDDDGITLSSQFLTSEAFSSMPTVSSLMYIGMQRRSAAVKAAERFSKLQARCKNGGPLRKRSGVTES